MTKNISFKEKQSVVQAWRASGHTQEQFCRTHPVVRAPRTLRAWVREVRRPEEGLGLALARLADAAQQVIAMVASMQGGVGPPAAAEARPGPAAPLPGTSEGERNDASVAEIATTEAAVFQQGRLADPWLRGGGFLPFL